VNRKMLSWIRAIVIGLSLLIFSCTLFTGAPAAISSEVESTSEPAEQTATVESESEPTEQMATVEAPTDNEIPSANLIGYGDMVVGFLQSGPGGGWREANSISFEETAADLGIQLTLYDSQNNLNNQKTAFRDFIDDDEVNVIVLAALETSGWDSLLRDAKSAGKVVVIEDRWIDAAEDLYATYIGSDFVEEGRKAAGAMCRLLEGSAKKNVVELVGDQGSSASRDRGQGFREKMGDCGITITQTKIANWNAADGKNVMQGFLQKTKDIQGVFAQNDDMALGAIQAIKNAGINPGKDIKLVSVDATRVAFEAMIKGELNATVECNPLLAPQVYEAALKALNGVSLPKWIPSNEEVYWAEDAADLIGTRKY
jgi:ABC-type sugar transport system substrate-binding protein